MRRRSAFTYIELMIVIVVMAILTIAAMPDGDSDTAEEGGRIAERFEADLALAKSLSSAQPDDPVVVKVDPDTNQYWLARESAEDTPIEHPVTKKPYLVDLTDGASTGLPNAEIATVDFDGDYVLKFDSNGGIDQATNAVMTILIGKRTIELTVPPAGNAVQADVAANNGALVAANANANANGKADKNANAK